MNGPLAGVAPEFAHAGHPVWIEIAPTAGGRPGFRPDEFSAPHAMDAHFLRWLWQVRQDTGCPMRVISDARGEGIGASRSAHKDRPCRAVDLQVFNAEERARLTLAAIRHGCVRWGTYPGKSTDRGPDQGGLHLDASESHPRPRNWTKW